MTRNICVVWLPARRGDDCRINPQRQAGILANLTGDCQKREEYIRYGQIDFETSELYGLSSFVW